MPTAFSRRMKELVLTGAALCALSPVLAWAGDPAGSRNPQAGDMTLGEPAPAPMGYLRFCARRPDQCGLDADAADPDQRAQVLVAKYYWSVAFAGGASPNLQLSPTSGAARPEAPPATSVAGRFDWSTIFGAGASSAMQNPAADEFAPATSPQSAPDEATTSTEVALALPPVNETASSDGYSDAFATPDPQLLSPEADPASDVLTSVGPEPNADAAPAAAGPTCLTWASKSAPVVISDAALRAATASASPATVQPAPDQTAGPLTQDRALMSLLGRVNDHVNDAIRYVSDVRQYGVDDYWTLPLEAGGSAAGDCKDYVLEKRRALIDAGVPAADLSIAIVKTTWGETHAVLLVSTDRGELVMDSLSSRIEPWRKAPYTWVERQAPGQQLTWVKIIAGRPSSTSFFSL